VSALPPFIATPPMAEARAREIAATLDLRALPADFYANPYPVYAALRETEPVRRMPDGSFFLTRHADLVAVTATRRLSALTKKWSSSPNTAPAPRSSSTTPPAWCSTTRRCTRACASSSWARSRRAIADMEPGLLTLVDGLLDAMEAKGGGDLMEDFASAIPVEIIGNLLGVPHADRAPLRGWSLAILGALEPRLTPEQETLGNQSVRDFTATSGTWWPTGAGTRAIRSMTC
jgi:cytochrome P450